MKKLNVFTKIGAVISFLAISGIAEAITGRGDRDISVVLFVVGFLIALMGYVE